MLISLLKKYADIVKSLQVVDFDRDGPNLRLKGQMTFVDDSVLSIKQIVLGESIFKYSYHWQSSEGQIICRWDNAISW